MGRSRIRSAMAPLYCAMAGLCPVCGSAQAQGAQVPAVTTGCPLFFQPPEPVRSPAMYVQVASGKVSACVLVVMLITSLALMAGSTMRVYSVSEPSGDPGVPVEWTLNGPAT